MTFRRRDHPDAKTSGQQTVVNVVVFTGDEGLVESADGVERAAPEEPRADMYRVVQIHPALEVTHLGPETDGRIGIVVDLDRVSPGVTRGDGGADYLGIEHEVRIDTIDELAVRCAHRRIALRAALGSGGDDHVRAPARDLDGAVQRTVVGDDDLDRSVVLRADARQRALQERRTVSRRNDDRDEPGRHPREFSCSHDVPCGAQDRNRENEHRPTVLPRRARQAAVTGALGAVLAIILLLPVLRAGVPAYIQDWTWPPDAAGLHAQLLQGWEPWLDDGLGRPNPFPTALPYFLAMAWATPVLAPRVELGLLLMVTFAGAFAAATVYARRTFGLTWGAYVCGAIYLAGPLVLTKLIAGHLPYLQAYAAFPLFALALHEGAASRRWCAAGALAAGITGLQAQFLGFDVAYALVALAFGAAAPRAVLGVGLLSVPLLLPTLLGPTLNAHGGDGILAQQRAVIAWERVQSSDLWAAVTGLGYFTRYVPRLDPTRLVMLLAVIPVLALRGAIAERAAPAARALVTIAVCGWLVVIGFNGPLAPILDALFTNVTAASLYRELFDASVLVWFPVAVLAAAGMERLPPLVAATCAAVAAVALVPVWAGYSVYFAAPPSSAELTEVSALISGDAAPPGRVVWWPSLQPIAPVGRREGGIDPLARTPLGTDLPLYEYQPLGIDGYAVSLAANGDWPAAAPQFAWLGVRYVVVRDDLASLASGRPRAATPPGDALVRVGNRGPFTVYRVPNVRPLITVEPATADGDPSLNRFAASSSEAIPRADWIVAAFPYLWHSPAVASCGPGSVIGGGATLASSRRAVDPRGALRRSGLRLAHVDRAQRLGR